MSSVLEWSRCPPGPQDTPGVNPAPAWGQQLRLHSVHSATQPALFIQKNTPLWEAACDAPACGEGLWAGSQSVIVTTAGDGHDTAQEAHAQEAGSDPENWGAGASMWPGAQVAEP